MSAEVESENAASIPCTLEEMETLKPEQLLIHGNEGVGVMKILMVVVLILSTSIVEASDRSLILNLSTYHFNRSVDWNEENYGIGYQQVVKRFNHTTMITVGGGGLIDSVSNPMPYLMVGAHFNLTSQLKVGINLTATSRKEDIHGEEGWRGIAPLPTVEYALSEDWSYSLSYIPDPNKKEIDSDAVLMSISINF